jgi:hypothetical protein
MIDGICHEQPKSSQKQTYFHDVTLEFTSSATDCPICMTELVGRWLANVS